MKLIYFTSKNDFACDQIVHTLFHDFPDLTMSRVTTLKNLKNTLCQTVNISNTVTLLLIESEKILKNLLTFRDLFSNSSVVLLLPNKPQMFQLGAKLYPRFITDFDNAHDEIDIVLHKLIEKGEKLATLHTASTDGDNR